MSLLFSATLLIGALLAFALILRKIRRAEVTIADSTFWFLFALSIVLMGLFRQIPFFFADLFSIESPANFVFVYVIAVLLLREFYTTVKVSKLQAKVNALVQREALSDAQARAAAAAVGGAVTPAAPAGSDAAAARASVAPASDAANVSAAATSPRPGKEDDHA